MSFLHNGTAQMVSTSPPDTPNDRVLNVMQGLELLLIKQLESKTCENKEEISKYLGYIRKSLEGQYDKLPESDSAPKQKSSATEPLMSQQWQGMPNYGAQAAAAQQQWNDAFNQVAQGIDWNDPFGFRRR